ncbi:MAG: hypothetical protein HGA98_00710 [Deltaproteobacteria bacterium]|nr:hypothetical protein [Deltaproteobacteria bacterium]
MPEGQSFPERLRALRKNGLEALAPLWVEQLPPGEALDELRGREGAVFRLQEARFLLDSGRAPEALDVLAAQADWPPGLAAIRDELTTRARELSPASADAPAVEARPGEAARDSFENALLSWLLSIRGWRGALSV